MNIEEFVRKSPEEKGQLIASELGEDLGQLELQDALGDLDELAAAVGPDEEEEAVAADNEEEEDEEDDEEE